jgi:hypothetical protein
MVVFLPVINSNPVFTENHRALKFISEKIVSKFFKPEDLVIKEGEDSTNMYFLAIGTCEVFVTNHKNEPQTVQML